MHQERLYSIITDINLSAKQKSQYLALEAEASLPYLEIDAQMWFDSITRSYYL
ncbi:hypothetical protein [Moritella marina]|uniref:hypothetical protein n=1 Tax=Moritella marina TaxID=90736 RepID=UPI00030D949B|nr:hypothetical protein [Moritella marina]